jgi:TorA maturation chaperone TorD
MNELSDKELIRIRLRFIDLIKSFFIEEPDAEKMGRWRGTFSALAQEQISPRFDNAVKEMALMLNGKNLKDLQEEHYKLFTDPFDGCQLDMTASFYLNGRAYGQALVEIRELMKEAGIAKDSTVTDPEDSLVVMLDTFASLLELEITEGLDTAKNIQSKLLENYLEPFAEKFESTLKETKDANFYRLCSRVLSGYLDLEKGLVISF